MILRKSFIFLAALFVLPSAGLAQPAELKPSAATLNLIEKLENGEDATASRLMARFESLSGEYDGTDFLTTSRAEVASILSKCALQSHDLSGSPRFMTERLQFQCESGKYWLSVIPEVDPTNPYVAVIGLRDEKMVAAAQAALANRDTTRPMIPRPPVSLSEPLSEEEVEARAERMRVLEEKRGQLRDSFGQAVLSGDLSSLSGAITPRTRFVYQTRDPFYKTDLVDLDGRGIEGGKAQIARAKSDLGSIKSAECELKNERYASHMCRWNFLRPDVGMFAFIHFDGEQIRTVQMTYVTRERMLEMRANAIEAGKIDG